MKTEHSDAPDRTPSMANVQAQLDELEDRADTLQDREKEVGQALDDAKDARERLRREVESLPHDLAALRDQLRQIPGYSIADALEPR